MHSRPGLVQPRGSMVKPSSLEDAVNGLRATFPEADLRTWAAQSESTACSRAHWELGLWIRNQWLHRGSPLATQIESSYGRIDADEISSIVVQALWRVLNGHPCPTLEELVPPHWRHWPRAEDLIWD